LPLSSPRIERVLSYQETDEEECTLWIESLCVDRGALEVWGLMVAPGEPCVYVSVHLESRICTVNIRVTSQHHLH
jgi:hypothetical protein